MTTTIPWLRGMLLAATTIVCAACQSIGEKEFACPGRPPGVRCMSATDVYKATHDTDTVAPTSPEALGDDPVDASARKHAPTGRSRRETESQRASREAHPGDQMQRTLPPVVDKPIPIRTPAKVMRVWIAPWEDTRGVLHAGGYAYVEVESRRWTFGEAAITEPVRFFSIQSTAVEAKKTVGKDQGASDPRTGTSERSTQHNSSTLPKSGVSK